VNRLLVQGGSAQQSASDDSDQLVVLSVGGAGMLDYKCIIVYLNIVFSLRPAYLHIVKTYKRVQFIK
jgi:hypothetical protein